MQTLNSSYAWVPVALLTTTMVGFCMGFGPVLVVMLGEMLPIQIKNFMSGLMNAWISATGLVAIATYHPMQATAGTAGTFWFYAMDCFLMVGLFLLLVPETKGQSLVDIERKLTSTDLVQQAADAEKNDGAARA